MPTAHIMMYPGRTLDQKRRLVRQVTDAIITALGVSEDAVTIRIFETSRENSAAGGVLAIDE